MAVLKSVCEHEHVSDETEFDASLHWWSSGVLVRTLAPIRIGAQRSGSDSGKEEGVNGYGVFAALTQTAETECS